VPATLFCPESTPAARRAEGLRASRLDPAKTRVEIVPGNHTSCVTEHSAFIAEKIQYALDNPIDTAPVVRVPPRRPH
jgi:hypothetical protein